MITRIVALIVGLLLSGVSSGASHGRLLPELDRLRVSDARAAHLVQWGLERSSIIRDLVAGVEEGPDFVYVATDAGLPGGLGGRMSLLGVGGKYRYLRIAISPRLPPLDAVATLAHELEHVREVRAHPDVRDHAALAALYRRIGHSGSSNGRQTWDTDAAQRTGRAVRREIAPSIASAR